MKKNTQKIIGVLAILVAGAFTPSATADLFTLTDVNPNPNIFECDVTAIEKDVTIAGSTVHVFTFKDENAGVQPAASAGIPIQVIKAKVGDMIICRFKNQLSVESASIHWHGIELDNDSDGTAVTQDAVLPGQSYTYQFQTFRPGVFWFHSHMLPGNTLFGGMYGVFIIENPSEAGLITSGVLPADADTHTLAMSDIEFDGTGKVGKPYGSMPVVTKTENELIEICHQFGIGPGGDMAACNLAQKPGGTVLVNGVRPESGAQTPKFIVPSGKRVRLRLLNESISRHFRLKLLNSGDNTLYRIGGQGGLLENIVVEGGTKGTWDTKYSLGETLIGSGMRADVLIYPTGAEGTIIQLVGNPTTGSYQISNGLPPNYPIAYFQISGTASDTAPAAGQAILAGTGEDIENIKSAPTVSLESPAPNGGSDDETIRLTTDAPTGPPAPFANKQPGIDQYAAVLDSNLGNGDWLLVPRPPVARYAHVGDVLELTVSNITAAAHPFHLHGFSMQPVRMIDNASGTTLYEFDYDEFVDTVDVQGAQSFVFRTRIDDRPKFCDISPSFPPGPVLAACSDAPCGGVVGRWLFHCHIVGHGALGMIGEVTILPSAVDNPPVITCPTNITVNTDPGLCTAVVAFTATATDDCGVTNITCIPSSGFAFPKGTNTVTCTATDTTGQTNSCSFDVKVVDNEPPKITGESVDKTSLWPPNHKMVDVTVDYVSSDNCGATCSLSVTSNEPINGLGDGDTAPDWVIVDDHHLQLRAERSGTGTGRIYTITITCTDDAGNSASKAVIVTVTHNITGPKSGASIRINTPVNFSGIFRDVPGRLHTAQWFFDSLTAPGAVTEPTSSKAGSISGTYTFTSPGVYAVKMNVTDKASGVTYSTDTIGGVTALVVIYDPNGGFVTGGGWVNSPAGALVSNPSLIGAVNFGFSSKYFKNATNPKGETQFDFRLANFSFNALNFDYLVIAGAKAQYKGAGKVNGAAGFNFILTVIDGQATGGGGVDKFRMKIWNKSTGAIVYDNQMGALDNVNPTTPVGDGSSIVIQP